MKFGKLEDISQVDFTLPSDYPIFPDLKSSEKAKIYTGATSWNNDHWKNVIYTDKTRKKDYGLVYSKHFNALEFNSTHYRTPSDSSIEKWINETVEDFKFCPKILQAISHRKNMVENKELLNKFIIQLSKFGDKLGTSFIQLPPYFKASNLHYLEAFLKVWPQEMSIAVELRDQGIHANTDDFKNYYDILTKYGAIPLITDVSGRRDILHMAVNSDIVFVRWVGNGLHETDYTRLEDWKCRIKNWADKGVKDVYFMIHQPDNEKTPEIAAFFDNLFENYEYIEHRGPKIIQKVPNLFD